MEEQSQNPLTEIWELLEEFDVQLPSNTAAHHCPGSGNGGKSSFSWSVRGFSLPPVAAGAAAVLEHTEPRQNPAES